MVQSSQVLTTGEAHRIPLVSARRATTQEDYLTVAEREAPMSTTGQTWIPEAAEKTTVNRMTVGQVNPFARIVNWLNYLGTRRADDSYLKSRQNIPRNFGIGGFGL
jgi:hypothetical protein